jgi:hypothetical protein
MVVVAEIDVEGDGVTRSPQGRPVEVVPKSI